jgi:p-hydroxybenzoate 3-monooxygenase
MLERHDRAYVEGRIRAGVLEQGTVDLLAEAGVDARLRREGLVHHGIELALSGARTRVDLSELTGGRSVTVYGQTEVVRDLIAARIANGTPLLFDVSALSVHDCESASPRLRFEYDGRPHELECDFIAGCDGFHGVCRPSIPDDRLKVYERVYPFAWLGILADTAPPANELIYARHTRGFALYSMRSRTRARCYLQCAPDEDLALWPDDRVWEELQRRLGDDGARLLKPGPVLDKSVTPMRSFVAEPMRFGRLYLAGDAAHIVPPTGAKGLNLAAADVHYLAEALIAFYRAGSEEPLAGYSAKALARVWKAQRFSWWMTSLLHNFADGNAFDERVRMAELQYVLGSRAALTALAENYVGLPF